MAAAVTLNTHERSCRYSLTCSGTFILGSGRRPRGVPRKGFSVRLPSELAHVPSNVWQGSGGQTASRNGHDAEHGGASHVRRAASGTAADGDGDGWRWQEPVLDGSLSTADRAVLALARAAANLSDKLTAERAAAAHGLSLVTNSEVCVGPLLPPFGSTLEDDGEEGDGMAPPPPLQGRPAVPEALRQAVSSSSSSLAGSASALLGAVLAGAGAASAAGTAAAAATSPRGSAASGAHQQPRHSSAPAAARGNGGVASADDKLRHLALMAAEGGGGDDNLSDDEAVLQAFEVVRGGGAAAPSSGQQQQQHQQGIMGAAAAALTRVARAASSTAADVPAPVGRAAAGAASAAAAAAQAAVATAARATALMLPHYGDPSSSWLVADDPAGGVRYIVIAAGPDLRRRSAAELTAELVNFESYDLGVKVNKRLYGEATALYARFMPLVMDFLEAVPQGNICFGGQGVGGSLAVLLQLMCCHRGLRFARLLPAVAVDSPAVLAQVPREQRRMWGHGGSREQQRQLPQDPLEDVLEDLMQRSVLEELGLPHDAVRNLVLPPQQQPHPPSAWYGTGHVADVDHRKGHATGPMLVLAAAEAAAGGSGEGAAAAGGGPARPQVFRLVGKVVQVETIGHLNERVWSSHASASSSSSAAAAASPASSSAAAAATSSMDAAAAEADGGTGELAAAAAAAAAALGSSAKRLDVATVGSIATAAATAAASAAVRQLRHVGVGALRAVTAADTGRAFAALTTAAPVGAAAAAASSAGGGPVRRAQGRPVAARQEVEEEDDASAWGV
ncbi:hypothetical protein PLESTB_001126500 [Pleodorina starrii]|uniref:Fungal lipase-like domain-containing protein n=1 Tax=Pleodorina starrii TaxID=330485 RepID=A0A9W6F5L8_9CHLO|nr:hypothetical protein PLESTM_001364100 [Pleodorina starrii]GLC56610.1 hypothetical protein PLESTB_001126500 [Pleodorina starrii]GLC76198.1 hypothetical protein PLESTF_001748700 [Pleodorina starrii]